MVSYAREESSMSYDSSGRDTTRTAPTSSGRSSLLAMLLGAVALGGALGVLAIRQETMRTELAALPGSSDEVSSTFLAEVTRLDEALHILLDNLGDARQIECEARVLAGLEQPEPETVARDSHEGFFAATCITDPTLARGLVRSGLHLGSALEQTRALRISYEGILEGMEDQAEEWASIPSIIPVDCARFTSRYGPRRDPLTGHRRSHQGLDLAAPYGAPVRASADGRVARAGWVRGYGRLVEVDHGNGIITRYGHNSRLLVQRGQEIRRGQILARLGSTGRANAPHLHYEVRVDGKPVNPFDHVLSVSVTE